MNRLYSYPRRRQSRGVVFSPAFVCLSVCLSFFRTISQEPMQLGPRNLT